jgi:TolB-like protein/DNA-binding winged helix-turn-helix (wHTH) protein
LTLERRASNINSVGWNGGIPVDLSTHDPAAPHTACFGPYHVDLRSRELFRDGKRIRIQNHPFQILRMLLEQPGSVVSREDLRQKLWPAQEYVDFDQGLNTAMMRLRRALDDMADSPRFVETLPRNGYRFIARVTFSNGASGFTKESPDTALEASKGRPAVIPDPGPNAEVPQRAKPWWRRAGTIAALGLTALTFLTIAFAPGKLHSFLGLPANDKALPTLAVLPFDSLSNDPAQNYLAEGMTEQLITKMGEIQKIRTVSRGSVMKYEGKHASLEVVAKDLHADYVFEGSITESSGTLRVTGNLFQVATRKHLWAQTYQKALGEHLSPQREIILDMAQNIQANLTSH